MWENYQAEYIRWDGDILPFDDYIIKSFEDKLNNDSSFASYENKDNKVKVT